ncbi:MAG: sugar-binding transcriptional regulator, partial [Mesorhizobium sp.]
MADSREDFEAIRQIHTVLVLHFVDGMKQNDIAAALNLSASKVNRLIAQGRKLGMLRIAVESPFQALVDIEKQLIEVARLASAIVTPTVAGSPESTLQQVGRAAANQLLETLR